MNIETKKSQCRKALQIHRKNAKAKYANAPAMIVKQFFANKILANMNWQDKFVSGYLPIGSEIDVLPLLSELRNRGSMILLPAIIATGEPLEFRLWNEGAELIEESFGTLAPKPECKVHVPDVVLSPLLGFDEACYRLGYGGGFYDRSLAVVREVKPVMAIGLAYDEQKLDNVPRDKHDFRLDAIITPSHFYSGDSL